MTVLIIFYCLWCPFTLFPSLNSLKASIQVSPQAFVHASFQASFLGSFWHVFFWSQYQSTPRQGWLCPRRAPACRHWEGPIACPEIGRRCPPLPFSKGGLFVVWFIKFRIERYVTWQYLYQRLTDYWFFGIAARPMIMRAATRPAGEPLRRAAVPRPVGMLMERPMSRSKYNHHTNRLVGWDSL